MQLSLCSFLTTYLKNGAKIWFSKKDSFQVPKIYVILVLFHIAWNGEYLTVSKVAIYLCKYNLVFPLLNNIRSSDTVTITGITK